MTEYCFYYPQNTTYYYLYQRYPNFPNLAVEVRMPSFTHVAPYAHFRAVTGQIEK